MDKLISQKMIGGTNSRVQNAVSDMQEKYKDILKLEQVQKEFMKRTILIQIECASYASNVPRYGLVGSCKW